MSDGGTQEAKESMPLDVHAQATSLSRSQMLLFLRTSCDGERNLSSEVPDVTLPRKASSQN